MSNPFPELVIHPDSGLTFPWSAKVNTVSVSSMHLGPEGVAAGMVMYVYWEDLLDACQQLLGYTARIPILVGTGKPALNRVPPWQHPFLSHLRVRAITEVRGIRSEGNSFSDPEFLFFLFGSQGCATGLGNPINYGPWEEYAIAEITLAFWDPPYYIRSDEDILDVDGQPQEWLRYIDKNWGSNEQVIEREGSFMAWAQGLGLVKPGNAGAVPNTTNPFFPGSVATRVNHSKVTRKWYQIPEQCIFTPISDGTPNGFPAGLEYAQTKAVNPITGFVRDPSIAPFLQLLYSIKNCLNLPIGGGYYSITGSPLLNSNLLTVTSVAGITAGDFIANFSDTGKYFLPGTYVVDINAGLLTLALSSNAQATANNVSLTLVTDSVANNKIFGADMGTLRYEHYELEPAPLQLPPYLMAIPTFAQNEALSQVQFNVVFHFDQFDPERETGNAVPNVQPHRGHNLVPWAGNCMWYPIVSQQTAKDSEGRTRYLTPFHYARFEDLFTVI